jgi:hypothetical protein
VPYHASPAQIMDETRMEAIAAYDREMDDEARDQRAVLALQRRICARRQRLARYADRASGTTLLRRHYGSTPEALPLVNPKALR